MRNVKCENCIFYHKEEVFDGEDCWIHKFCDMKQNMLLVEHINKCKYFKQEVEQMIEEYYVSYYDHRNQYHSTKYYMSLKEVEQVTKNLEAQGYNRVTINKFRY